MQNWSYKSIPLLISKLTSAIVASHRGREVRNYHTRREEIKDELVLRGEAAIEPVLALMDNSHDNDVVYHAADIIGRIGSTTAVIPLAQMLAQPQPQHVKQSAAKALLALNTPDAALAVNIWQGRVEKVRERVQSYVSDNTNDEPLLRRLGGLAERHHVSLAQIADAYLLQTATENLSIDARARLDSLRLSPGECAYIEEIAAPQEQ